MNPPRKKSGTGRSTGKTGMDKRTRPMIVNLKKRRDPVALQMILNTKPATFKDRRVKRQNRKSWRKEVW